MTGKSFYKTQGALAAPLFCCPEQTWILHMAMFTFDFFCTIIKLKKF